jgi:hypothetical protein
MDSYLDASINPAGYEIWGKTDPRVGEGTVMAEWRNYGPGFNLTGRLEGGVAKELTGREVRAYDSPVDVFMDERGRQPYVGWIDGDV